MKIIMGSSPETKVVPRRQTHQASFTYPSCRPITPANPSQPKHFPSLAHAREQGCREASDLNTIATLPNAEECRVATIRVKIEGHRERETNSGRQKARLSTKLLNQYSV
jgi:hypothetical protein